MSSNLKNELALKILKNYNDKLFFFFNDLEFAYTSD